MLSGILKRDARTISQFRKIICFVHAFADKPSRLCISWKLKLIRHTHCECNAVLRGSDERRCIQASVGHQRPRGCSNGGSQMERNAVGVSNEWHRLSVRSTFTQPTDSRHSSTQRASTTLEHIRDPSRCGQEVHLRVMDAIRQWIDSSVTNSKTWSWPMARMDELAFFCKLFFGSRRLCDVDSWPVQSFRTEERSGTGRCTVI
jgi:hypothetical protein